MPHSKQQCVWCVCVFEREVISFFLIKVGRDSVSLCLRKPQIVQFEHNVGILRNHVV